MLRIGTACGSGLGSSFMVQMNIESILKDLEDSAGHLGDVRILNSIIDMDELRELVTGICQEKGLI
ncbi:TPA: hypothetical protein ACGNU7_001185 [Streptococcus agalactiae]|nr:hypothetical protein [Streptococcus agalactiae]